MKYKIPNYFDKHQKAVWNATIGLMMERDRLNDANILLFEAYCVELGAYQKLMSSEEFSTVPGRGEELKLNPAMREARERLKKAMELDKLFGISPESDKKVGGGQKAKPAANASIMSLRKAK